MSGKRKGVIWTRVRIGQDKKSRAWIALTETDFRHQQTPMLQNMHIYICRNTLPRSWGGGGISITGVSWGQVRQTLVRNGLGIEVERILPCGRRWTSSVFLNLSTLHDHPAFWESEAGYLVPQRFSLTSKRRLDCLFSSSSFYLPAFRDYVCAFSFSFFFPVVPQHIFDVSQAVVIHQT